MWRRTRQALEPDATVRQPPGGAQPVIGRGRGALEFVEADGARRMRSVHARAIEREPLSVVARLSFEIAQVGDRRRVSSYAIDDGESLLSLDPLAVPEELLALAQKPEPVIVTTAPWRERDTGALVEVLGAAGFTPGPTARRTSSTGAR